MTQIETDGSDCGGPRARGTAPLAEPAGPVLRLVDYEPHPGAPHDGHGRSGRRARSRTRRAPDHQVAQPSTGATQAAAFADTALRRVLEVLDRRRPAGHLHPLLAPGLIDSVAAVIGTETAGRPGGGPAATLRRVRLQPNDIDERSYEVAASYTRGGRRRALACRIDLRHTHWQVVALHLG